MADFLLAMAVVDALEGVYSNEEKDTGGETLFGISRAFNSSYEIWPMLDKIRADHPMDWKSHLDKNDELRASAMRFYRMAYWDPLRGEEIASQPIANELMDIAINIKQGKRRAVEWLQRALNGLNRDGCFWTDIKVDGVMGRDTLYAIKMAAAYAREASVVKLINCFQGVYYAENSQEVFLHGLLRRVKL